MLALQLHFPAGAALFVVDSGLSLRSSVFLNNQVMHRAGALYANGHVSRFELVDCVFANNGARNGSGGAVFLDMSALPYGSSVLIAEVTNVTFVVRASCIHVTTELLARAAEQLFATTQRRCDVRERFAGAPVL